MTVDELAAAIRAYVGRPRTSPTEDSDTWYIDINSQDSDETIRELAEGIIEAGSEAVGSDLGSDPA